MARILTVDPDQAKGLRKLVARAIGRQFGGELPGVFKILLTDFRVAIPTSLLVYYLHERKGSPLSKLQREMTPPWSTASSGAPPDWGPTRRPCVA
jgi:hypothetical protein